jgi:CheY-like chemotaxis protein/signal transduction histidine kinase
LIFLSLAGVFIGDFNTRFGITVWVLYIIPVCLSLLTWRPFFPLGIALLVSVLMLLNIEDVGDINPYIAELNSTLGIITIQIIAIIGYFFIRNKIAIREGDWIQSGQNVLSDIMVGEQRLADLCHGILSFLCDHLDASTGVLYVAQNGGFDLVSSCGGLPEGIPRTVNSDFGLIGRAIKDQRIVTVDEVPKGYLNYGSAMGSALPQQLLIVPAVHNQQTLGIIELGFIRKLDVFPQHLLDTVRESIGIALKSAEYRRHLEILLEETQQQAQRLQVQEEELRVSNEELEEYSKSLLKSQEQLERQQTELEQTNAYLEEQTQQLEQQRDSLAKTKAELQLRARELEQASQYKSDFLANMSHELRTPLNSTLILSKLLADNPGQNLTEEQVRYAETIQNSGNDLLTLINDILDLSKIEAGHLRVDSGRITVEKLVTDLTRIFEPMAMSKGLGFNVKLDDNCPEEIETDGQRLEQILKNLLSNAIKFTDTGEVGIEIRKAPRRKIVFAVHDTGIGIRKEEQESVFEAFQQVDSTRNRKFGGTGLGLSISQELARLLGGEIQLDSESDQGSVFTLSIPMVYSSGKVKPREDIGKTKKLLQPEFPSSYTNLSDTGSVEVTTQFKLPPQKLEPPRPGPMEDDRQQLTEQKYTVLVVEDDLNFARILLDLLHELNFQVIVEAAAEDGWQSCLRFKPNAVILDIGLPDHSGLSVLDRVKQTPQTRHIPVHIISGVDHTRTALAMGAIGYLHKPVSREKIVELLKQIENRLSDNIKRLLIVEDDAVQRDSLQKLLGTTEIEIVAVATAQACLEQLKAKTFDCMVLDLNLPDKSGLSLLQTLSEEDSYSFPPVIVYTGKSITPEEEQQLRRFSDSIIIKGAKSPERLLDEVTLFLHQVVADLPKPQQTMLKRARNHDAVLDKRRVLVVEDDIRNVYALTSILEPRGVSVEIARNGREALELLEKTQTDGETKIDLVLMDIMMPEIDGLTATRKIRLQPHWRNLPIIMLTAKVMKDDQDRCLEAGANDYLAKPLDVEKLLSLVRVWMPQ